ncbi:MAG: hypothetical protein HY537_01970 [Deltaproteobacteria bacterium]|nr:hypothetical protein [Deltaproteobacteria bacterium]
MPETKHACEICKDKVTPSRKYCDIHSALARRRFNNRRKKHGLKTSEWVTRLRENYKKNRGCIRCEISGVTLSSLVRDNKALYPTVDHEPGSTRTWMLSAWIINDMKSEMTLEEFKKIIILLARCFECCNDKIRNQLSNKLTEVMSNLKWFSR